MCTYAHRNSCLLGRDRVGGPYVELAHAPLHHAARAPVALHVDEERGRERSTLEALELGRWDRHDLGDDGLEGEKAREMQHERAAGGRAYGSQRQARQAVLLPEPC